MLKSFRQVIEEETSLFDRVLPAIKIRKGFKSPTGKSLIIGKRGDWHNNIAGDHNIPEDIRDDDAYEQRIHAVRRGDMYKYFTKGFYDPLHKKYHHAWSPKVKGFDAADLKLARSKVAEFR
jgi:hypothetical protein